MKNKNEITNWPKTQIFTITDVMALNPHITKTITCRVNFNKIKDQKNVIEFGASTGGKGRPEKIYAYLPITPILVAKAKSDKINLADGVESKYLNYV